MRFVAIGMLVSILMILLISPQNVIAEPDETSKRILIDYSHGQGSSIYGREVFDPLLFANLTEKGYDLVFAYGGLNASILEGVDGFLLGSIRGIMDGFTQDEITAIADWFNEGNRFLWVAYDSDYPDPGGPFINGNSTLILEAIGSHVYGEPTHIWDNELNCGSNYRPIANVTSKIPFVRNIVKDVDAVLMHGATCLYGSQNETPSSLTNVVALENTSIANVTPFLYYSPTSYIHDSDTLLPIAHRNGDNGPFAACTIETYAGLNKTGVIIVSGSAPYGSYCPMSADHYYNWTLNGYRMILQAVEFGMSFAPPSPFEIPVLMAGLVMGIVFMVLIIIERRPSNQ
ncbi:MAG: hypothetical protein ACFFEK_10655 [Candidatus Thorarchaeota archaeon]